MKKISASMSASAFFSLGTALLVFMFLLIVIPSVAFVFHGRVSNVWLVMAAAGAAAVQWKLLGARSRNIKLSWLAALFVVVVASVMWSAASVDGSYDGNSYHKQAVGAMRYGWNPVWQSIDTFNESKHNPVRVDHTSSIWTDHYPKAHWVFGAEVYNFTHNIESGKSMLPLTIVAVFCIAYAYFGGFLGRNRALLVSGLLALNPVAVMQLYTYYNDGILGNIILIILLLMTMVVDRRLRLEKTKGAYLLIAVAIILAANLKFTGLAYAGITIGCYYVYLLLRPRANVELLKRLTLAGAAGVLLGVFVVGLSTYPKNYYLHHAPLYPLSGAGKVDIMTSNRPVGFANESRLSKFVQANFGAANNASVSSGPSAPPPQYKIPFTANAQELAMYAWGNDMRIGGYGVWFGGILLLSVGVGVWLLIRYGGKYRTVVPLFVLPVATVLVVVLGFSDAWWARYLPQLYILPIIVIIALFMLKVDIVPYVIVFALLFNIVVSALVYQGAQTETNRVARAGLTMLKCGRSPQLYTTVFDGYMYNLHDKCRDVVIQTGSAVATPKFRYTQIFPYVYAGFGR